MVRVHELGIVQNRPDSPEFGRIGSRHHVCELAIPDTAVLIFHDQVCQLSSSPSNVSMLSKPRAFNCGHWLAALVPPCGCHRWCSSCCIALRWSGVNIPMLRVTLHLHVKRPFALTHDHNRLKMNELRKRLKCTSGSELCSTCLSVVKCWCFKFATKLETQNIEN